MDLSSARDVLVQEARELLANMESALLEMESAGPSPESVNAIFRTAHTIKGSAGLFGLDLIVGFTHTMESVLDRVRSKRLVMTEELVILLLRCGDYLAKLIDGIEASKEDQDPDSEERHALIGLLQTYLDHPSAAALAAIDTPPDKLEREDEDACNTVSSEHWHLSLRFGPDVLRNGMDPLSFICYLANLGEIVYLHTITTDIPSAPQMDPESCYLGFEIDLDCDADKKKLDSVFEFVREDSRIRILPPRAKMSEYIDLINSLPESCHLLGEILVAGGTLTQNELDQVLALQTETTSSNGEKPRLGELLIQEHMVQPPVVAAALIKQRQGEEKRSAENKIVKVEANKLDQLIDLVGELVIACEGARILAERTRQATLSESLSEVSELVGQIRDRSLDLRMIPIGEIFQRFPRVVRDVSKELGKKIDLIVTGADTELDKSMVEKLSDPLMHLVRNAIDHGIEPPDLREAQGKPATGEVRLHAFHETGSVVIEVSDDGRGLDANRILNKAIERGMVAADAALNENDIYKLIFEPGFSTAEQVTNLSGRGVGMDVVKRSIDQLRGDIELDSSPGQGTRLRIRLPLTLAIISAFQVKVGKAIFIIPLDMVEECVEFPTNTKHDYINLRGLVLPFVRLREYFAVPGEPGSRENIVVVKYAGRRVGIVVDALLGETQTVIKPLSKWFSQVKGIGGSSIQGSGEVALIIDVPALIQQSQAAPVTARPIFSA